MKKLFYLLAIIGFCFFVVSANPKKANASEYNEKELVSTTVEYFEDGSYLKYEIYEEEINSNARAVGSKMGEKVVTKYSAINTVIWTYTLIGYFSFDEGVSSRCYKAEYETDINGSSWSFSNGSAQYEANVANGKGTFTFKILGITSQTVDIDIHITCDIYGNLS